MTIPNLNSAALIVVVCVPGSIGLASAAYTSTYAAVDTETSAMSKTRARPWRASWSWKFLVTVVRIKYLPADNVIARHVKVQDTAYGEIVLRVSTPQLHQRPHGYAYDKTGKGRRDHSQQGWELLINENDISEGWAWYKSRLWPFTWCDKYIRR